MGRERALHAVLLALTAVGCDRAPGKEAVAPSAPPSSGPTKVAPPPAAPIVPAPPPPTEPTPAAIGSAAPAAPPAPVAAKPPPPKKLAPTRPAPAPPPAPPPPAPPRVPTTLVTDKLFRIELAPLPPCTATTACAARLVVHALGGFKVNAEYPTKFVATATAGVTVDGTGTFAVADKSTGTMTLTFRAAAPGTSRVAGALKLSVCTDDLCEIAAPSLAFDVPVSPPQD